MNEAEATATTGGGASRRRNALPPWQVALGFGLLLGSRFVDSQLAFPMHMDVKLSLFNTSFLLICATFWLWPRAASNDPHRSAAPWARWGLLTALLCGAPFAFGARAATFHENVEWLLVFVVPYSIYCSALLYPFPQLFGNLRLDRTIPASRALGPCALFAFYSLIVPALIESFSPDSPKYLRAIALGAPPLTAWLVFLDLRERSSERGWWRALGGLLWRTALLPFLFALGNVALAVIGSTGAG